MEYMFEFQDKHGPAYDWSPEEVIYLLSQIYNLAASSYVYDTDQGSACRMAASGVRLALMSWEADIDVRLLPDVITTLGDITIEGFNIAHLTEHPTTDSKEYVRRFDLAHDALNLFRPLPPEPETTVATAAT